MRFLTCVCIAIGGVVAAGATAEARQRPNAAQIKKYQEEMLYRQQEMLRYHNSVAAKEREVYLSFDENGNGKLEGAENAKYRKHLSRIQAGKEPNPLASIPLPGQVQRKKK